MLKRSIDFDPFALTIEEKLFRSAKRACGVFAVAAITISALDLMNVPLVEKVSAFIHNARSVELAELPSHLRKELGQIAIPSPGSFALASADSVAVAIPRAEIAKMVPPPMARIPVATVRRENVAIAGLAEARSLDAVEVAMATPVSFGRNDFVPALPVPSHAVMQSSAVATSPAIEVSPVQAALASASVPSAPTLSAATGSAGVAEIATPPRMQLASADPGMMPSAGLGTSMVPPAITIALPATISILPPPAPGVPPPSPAQRLGLSGAEYAKAEKCLANAIYFESRSEPLRGQIAVAQVVMNRVFSPFYPNNVCDVVYQNAHRRLACQFTFACDGKRKTINERGAWARANRIAKQTLDGKIYLPEVAKSTHYHATYVHPNWVREMRKLVRYGIHNFYRPIAWGDGADAPVWGTAALAKKK